MTGRSRKKLTPLGVSSSLKVNKSCWQTNKLYLCHMRKKYVAYYKGCTIEVTGEKDFMYRIIKGERMVLFVDMFYRSTTDALKGAMRWVDNNVRKE